jgi:hypothetical protein
MDFTNTFERVKKDLEFDELCERILSYQSNQVAQRKMVNILSHFIDIIPHDECPEYQDFYYTNVNHIPYSETTISSFVRLALKSEHVYKILNLIVTTCNKFINDGIEMCSASNKSL